jgi:hypothetical protein
MENNDFIYCTIHNGSDTGEGVLGIINPANISVIMIGSINGTVLFNEGLQIIIDLESTKTLFCRLTNPEDRRVNRTWRASNDAN